MDSKLRSRCCGLAAVQYHGTAGSVGSLRVDFIHRTAYDYLSEESVWQNVSEYSKLSRNTVDFLLLVSAVHLLKRSPPFSQDASDRQYYNDFVDMLAACFEYSYAMSCCDDARYMPFLRMADMICLKYASDIQGSPAESPYHDASQIFIAKREYRLPAVVTDFERHSKLDISAISMLVFAKLGFPSYFATKLHTEANDEAMRSLLLLYMLVLCTSADLAPELGHVYSKNIATLLQQGVNPNTSAVYIYQPATSPLLYWPTQLGNTATQRLVP